MSVLEGIRDGLADLTRQEFPTLSAPPGPHSYRVVAVRADGRCDLRAVKEGPPLDIPNVDHWTGSGAASKPRVGSIAVVSFLDGDPNAPMIGTYQPLRMAGGIPTEATLDAVTIKIGPTATAVQLAGSGLAVARVGDAVSLGYLVGANAAGPVTFTLFPTPPAPPDPPDPDVPPAFELIGAIIEGSSKVTSG